jgi:hypothetical protein
MADDDLTSLPGLLDRHRRILAERLEITTYEGLIDADPQVIVDAVSRARARTSLTVIRRWQDLARRRRKEGLVNTPEWEPAAIFVLSFEQRETGEQLERRLVAEQTELEGEQPISSWPGWDCRQLCGWLQRRVGGEGAAPPESAGAGEKPVELSIQQVVVVDAGGRAEAISGGEPRAEGFTCTAAGWLEVAVAGHPARGGVQVALRLRRGGLDRSTIGPLAVPREGPARIELSEAPPGVHSARVVAWAPDASTAPTAVDLGTLTVTADC